MPSEPSEPIAQVLTADDVRATAWQDVPGEVDRRDTRDYAPRYRARADAARDGGDARAAAAYDLLSAVCSLHLRPENADEPFVPLGVGGGFRTASVDDFTREDGQLFGALALDAQDPTLRARLGDVAWIRARDFRAARAAAAAYLTLARRLATDEEQWPRDVPLLERGLQLAASLGGGGREERTAIEAFVGEVLTARMATEDGFLSADLFRLAAEYRIEHPAARPEVGAVIATRAQDAGAWHRAQRYWELAGDLAQAVRDPAARADMTRRLAEAYAAEAEVLAGEPHTGAFQAAHRVQQAIEVLRRLGGERERIAVLHARLLGYQRASTGTLAGHSTSIDITDEVDRATAAVGDKPLGAALLTFAVQPLVPRVERLRAQAQEHAERYVLSHLFPKVMLSRDGKVTARQGSMRGGPAEEREAALRVEMFQLAGLHYQFYVSASIHPARRRIMQDHPLRGYDLVEIVRNNPLVPPGRELLWAEGLYAGFAGDFPKAVHLLIPQLEHALRAFLAGRGVLVSTLDSDGTQDERNLNTLLYPPYRGPLEEAFGADFVFSLQGLLVERFGANLRNEMAHGILDYHACFSPPAVYTWWLLFRFCCLPFIADLNARAAAAAEVDDGDPRVEDGPEADLAERASGA